MSRVSLSKASLAKQNQALRTYERFLPSLDLKRRQLMAERAKEMAARDAALRRIDALRERVRETLPMLAYHEVAVEDLVRVRGLRLGEENLLGVRLPRLDGLDLERADYGLLTKPHWVDSLLELLAETLHQRVLADLYEQRIAELDAAVRKVTQRVNLFDKVLIPRTRENIKRIRVYLSDAERAAIVRSKIAKNKRLRESLA
ncbi:V-type ATP synthase subunit D [Halochromatium glycolicum]|jgi:V/A-type H+-transporting ATPase subunit D|uniref:V-type ATP synthase subunit D n=1 Tax=Halochromatium glycolicum TaxID=85075 RepID=A0AAJ0U2Z8_9GAMM|nr:V-type ATP synthase subunit D [Halochromatium glycolicum]MBK1704324.1 V-type ATP synthase subunit D [Halochromatium glycolicum]